MGSIEEAGALDEDGESSETKGLLVIDRSVLSSECSGSWSCAYYLEEVNEIWNLISMLFMYFLINFCAPIPINITNCIGFKVVNNIMLHFLDY